MVRIPHNRARLSPKPTEILSQMPTIWSQEHLEEFGPAVDPGVDDGHAPFIIFHMDMAMFHQKIPKMRIAVLRLISVEIQGCIDYTAQGLAERG
jgi:hypothetical protein